MKALIKDRPVRGGTYTSLPIPKIGDDDLLVRVHAAAICGTAIHIYQWNEYAASRVKLPLLFGHEYAAEVVAVGKNITAFKKGDRVAAETHIPCGHCYQCTTGLQHICKEANVYGVTGRIMWDTWWIAQSLLLSGKIDIRPVITHFFELKDFDTAMQLAESGSAGKIMLKT